MNRLSSSPPTARTRFEYMAAGESFGPQKGVIIHIPSYNCSSYPSVFQSMNRFEQIFVPMFNGIGDFRLWVNSYSGILGLHSMKEEEKIQSLSMYLEGPALRLHKAYLAGKSGYFSWLDYVFHMSHWYDVGSTHLDISVVEWKYLTQKGNLLDYYEHFARTRVVMVCSEGFAVEYFIGGLREEYQDFVRGKLPSTVYEAYCWAYNYEGFLLPLENLDNLMSTLASTAQKSNIESCQETISRTSEIEFVLDGVDEEFQNVEEKDCELKFENDQEGAQASESYSVTCQMELVSSTLRADLIVEKLSHQEDLEHEPGLEKEEEKVEEKKEIGNDLSVSKISVDFEHLNLVDKEHEVVVENDQLEGQALEAITNVGCQVSTMGNVCDVPMEFESKVLVIDFLGVEARIEMLHLEIGKKIQMNRVKLVVMADDRMKEARKKYEDAYFCTLAALFVPYSYRKLVVECGHIAKGDIQCDYKAKGDIQWDYKRYKKKGGTWWP